jgi:3-methyladenine DNA glycosylase AlkD
MNREISGDSSLDVLREKLLKALGQVQDRRLSTGELLSVFEEDLDGLNLYPPAGIWSLGMSVAEVLDRSPELAVELALGMIASRAREVRALAATILAGLARFQPGMWTDPARHLITDDDWEVRDLAAHIFDSYADTPGAAEFHFQFVCDVVRGWTQHDDERVRRASTQALLGFAAGHAEFRPQLLRLIAPLLNDEQEYVRHSLAAALRSLGKMDAALVFDFVESHFDNLTNESRDIFRLVLDHSFAARHPQRKAALLAQL